MKKDAIIDLIENDLNEMRRLVETFRDPDRIASAFIELLSQKHESLGKEISLLNYWASENIGSLGKSELVAEIKAHPQKPAEAPQKRNQQTVQAVENSHAETEKVSLASQSESPVRDTEIKQESSQSKESEDKAKNEIPDYFSDELENMPDPLENFVNQHKEAPTDEAETMTTDIEETDKNAPFVSTENSYHEEVEKPREKESETSAEYATAEVKVSTPLKASATDIANYGTPVTDVTKAIGINDRFLYQRELFKGNKLAFDAAIETINAAASYNQAYQYLRQSFGWDESDPTVEAFLKAVHRRFL